MINGQLVKGIIFLIIEQVLNTLAHINEGIYLDLNGLHQEAFQSVDIQFALFYPGFYVAVIYDSFRYSSSDRLPSPGANIYFLVAGFIGTFSIIYARLLPSPLLLGGASIIVPILLGVFLHRR
ncbi:hypothetical protein FE783_15990 [Paenibacillus mesophilus]|uniref:hypothetical protein n=1 Tax=Paenibacillus mesophilus TaxID=2582849 RepID=UPI00110D9EB6|nr:hypothetical protein [Paenibacillus mesophilus]TMV48563.1 hypothetical protein FE783_15990 [Paenibacillus mesophilus]